MTDEELEAKVKLLVEAAQSLETMAKKLRQDADQLLKDTIESQQQPSLFESRAWFF